MDLNIADLTETLQCPFCHDIFEEPKLLICGHTICQKCVEKIVATHPSAANADPGRDGNCVKCTECGRETEVPPDGLATNYSLHDLVGRARKPLMDACACSGCGKRAHVADVFTCETCQKAFNGKPLWVCALCAMKEHRGHAMSECNKATQQQVLEACQSIATSGSLVDIQVGLTTSHLNVALEKAELISQLQTRGFSRLEERLKNADQSCSQEDVAVSLKAAKYLVQKLEQ
ncbi:TAM-1 protein, partial [Aphelenchoides avenae]